MLVNNKHTPEFEDCWSRNQRCILFRTPNQCVLFCDLERRGVCSTKGKPKGFGLVKGPLLVIAWSRYTENRDADNSSAYLIAVKKVDPRNILLVTFEQKSRCGNEAPLSKSIRVFRRSESYYIRYFHSVFLYVLRKWDTTMNSGKREAPKT